MLDHLLIDAAASRHGFLRKLPGSPSLSLKSQIYQMPSLAMLIIK